VYKFTPAKRLEFWVFFGDPPIRAWGPDFLGQGVELSTLVRLSVLFRAAMGPHETLYLASWSLLREVLTSGVRV